nr:MAG TPA: ATP synthase [Caudoviricetes sp.]
MFNFKTYIAQGSSRILGLKYMLFNFFRVVRFAHYICAERR